MVEEVRTSTQHYGQVTVHGDFFQDFPKDVQADLAILDPPYYEVVDEDWDKEWKKIEEYLKWSDHWIEKVTNSTKLGSSLWVFGYSYQLARLLPKIENMGWKFKQQVVIDKGMQSAAGRVSDKLKSYPNVTEHLYFFFRDSRDYIRDILNEQRRERGMTPSEVNEYLGKATNGGGTWSTVAGENKPLHRREFPTKSDWAKMQDIFDIPKYEDVVFTFNLQHGITDVWDDIDFYNFNRDHPTQKPKELIERIIKTGTNDGETVIDPFAGSLITHECCFEMDRNFYGTEKEKEYFGKGKHRIKKLKEKKEKVNKFFDVK